MKIYVKELVDSSATNVKVDLEYTLYKMECLQDKVLELQRELYFKSRNIFVKTTKDRNYLIHHGEKYFLNTEEPVKVEFFEISLNDFLLDDQDEFDVSNVIRLSNIEENGYDAKDISEYIYIDQKNNNRYRIRGYILDTKDLDNRYFKLIPAIKWYVLDETNNNEEHLVTLCRDFSCDETKSFWVDTTETNKHLFNVLKEVFDYIEDNLGEFDTYYCSSNTSHSMSELKQSIREFLEQLN